MASDNEASCASDPNFAVICSFLGCFGKSCGIIYPDIARLQEMLENTQEVSQELIDLHVKLLRKTRKTVSPEKWERALVKFCHTYSNQDGWELERFGYKKARIAVKLRLLKVLLETQFDLNQKFKNEVNKLAADELRVEPLGRDKGGLAYWCQLDEECNIRVYKEDLDEENWELVAKDREGVINLISTLSNGEAGAIPINEDSNSLEISEKPIIDTGQVTTSPSLEDEIVQENGVHVDEMNDKQLPNGRSDDFEDEQDQDQDQDQEDIANEVENDEEDMDAEEDMTNDESSKQITEEDDSQEMVQTPSTESRCTNASSPLPVTNNLKTIEEKVDTMLVEERNHREATDETPAAALASESKPAMTHKPTSLPITAVAKSELEESPPLKSIETPVITSPLKLVNIADLKQSPEEKLVSPATLTATVLNATKKHGAADEIAESVVKTHEKLPGKNNLSFPADPIPVGHSKLFVKPIDQLAANLVRMQSEKLEKPSGPKSLEKIAESLARSSGGVLGNMMNGEDDRLPQDFCARNQSEKSATIRGHRGIDLSTSPRGWESANEQNRPMDFSGIDLSSRKLGKTMDLPSPGYRTPDFQHREMDLSTKKSSKPPEVPNLPYDARSVMMRNHAMVADLSKRQMPFTAYEMSSTPYHNTARLPAKEEHRLPSYTILPDPSKITALRMNNASMKRPLEGDDAQQDMLKRIRADVIPIRGSMEKRSMMSGNWREEVGEAIEEPIMMVQGEGSGSDCDVVNPVVGEAIEEPTMFFHGEGSGAECETGNPGDDASTDNKESNESKNEPDSASATLSQSKVLNEDEVSADTIMSNKTPVKLNRNYQQSNVSLKDNCQIVDMEKPKFKPTLGVQIIPKSTTGSVKRLSRWDVGKPEEKTECDSSIISNEGDISLKENTNRERDDAEQRLSSAVADLPKIGSEDVADANRDVKVDSVSTENETIEDNVKSQVSDVSSENTSTSTEREKDLKIPGPTQCDSSVSSCQADTSPRLEPCINPEIMVDSTNVQNAFDSSSLVSRESDLTEIADNECKPPAASPPRFFFGPNCISYTSKSDELESIQSEESAIVHDKTDIIQHECVSSSKSIDDKTKDFDQTQTNNNSLKTDLFTAESDEASHENDSKDLEKIEEPSNTWAQQTSAALENSEKRSDVPEHDISNVSIAEVEMAECTEPNVQEAVCTSKKIEEDDTNPTLEPVTANESINEVCVTKEDSIKVSSVSEHSIIEPEEGEIIESSQCDQSVDSAKVNAEFVSAKNQESSFEKLDDATLQLSDETDKNENPPATDYCKKDEEDDRQSAGACVFKEEHEKTESVTTVHSSLSSLTQNSQAELADLREFEDGNNSNELLDSAHSAGSACFPETSRSLMHSISDDTSEKYHTLQKNDLDSVGESYDKQSDKNDNFSEIDGQEDHSTDTDNEKMKGLIGSDADSMCVNYDRSSERTDALSDVGMHDDGSGDSEEIKEKALNDVQVNDTTFSIDPETQPPENSLVTSSVREDDKHDLVPTLSSSDDACVQDSLSLEESETAQVADEKIEDASSIAEEPSTFDTVPAMMVPETNIFELSKPDIVESTKETDLPNPVQSTSEYTDDVSENPSSCVDPDSNEEMVIDDRVSESNESSKEIEETTTGEEQQEGTAQEVPTESERKEDPILADVKQSPYPVETEAEILKEESKEEIVHTESEFIKGDSEIRNNDEQDAIIAEDICARSKEIIENAEESKVDAPSTIVPESEVDSINASVAESEVDVINASVPEPEVDAINASVPESEVDAINASVAESEVDTINASLPKSEVDAINASVPETEVDSINASVPESEVDAINASVSETEVDVINASVPESEIDATKNAPAAESEVDATNVTSQEEVTQKEITYEDNKQSLVANYDSDSNDNGSDDVFEPDDDAAHHDVTVSIEQEKNEEPELYEKSSVKEDGINSENLVSDVPKEQLSVEKQIEEPPIVNEVLDQDTIPIQQDVKISTKEERADETEGKSACNNIEYHSNDESTASLSKDVSQELNIQDISVIDHSKAAPEELDATKLLAAPVVTEETTEPLLNIEKNVDYGEKSKEHLNNLIDSMKTTEEDVPVKLTEKTDHLTSENVCDLDEDNMDKFEKTTFAQERAEFNDIDNQVTTVLHTKEQHVRNVDERQNVSADIESVAISKDVSEPLVEELPITQPCKKLKEDLEEYRDKDNKCDVGLSEECLTKSFVEDVSLPIHTESDVMPVKLDNALTTEKSHTWKTEDVNLEGSVSTDALYYTNSMSTKVENEVNNVDSCNNQNEPFNINMSVNKITENFAKSPLSSTNDESTFPVQEIVPEIGAIKSDPKKEASKRLNDASDVEGIPPIKSKPPYFEDDDRILKNLTSTDIQTPKTLETFNEIEKLESKIESEEKAPAISTTQLFQNDFGMINASAVTASIDGSTKIEDLEMTEKTESPEIQNIEIKADHTISDDSTGMDNDDVFNVPSEEVDPLASADDDTLKNIEDESKISIRVKPVAELYEGWKMDNTVETPKISRKRRNSAHESNSEDGAAKQEDEEMMGGKRMKLRGKRMPDKELRKSIEESRVVAAAVSSEDEAMKSEVPDNAPTEHVHKDTNDDPKMIHTAAIDRKTRGRPRGRRRRGFRGARSNRPKHVGFQGDQTSEVSPGVHLDGTPNDSLNMMTPATQKKRKKRKMVLGLEIGRDIALEETPMAQDETPVRQSRRIAQLKIKEQADRRRIEEETLREIEDKKESEKKKRKKQKPESEEEIIIKEIEKEKKSKKKRRKRKKKKMLAKFNESNPWQSSSGSSSDEENENEDEEEEEEEIESEGSLLFKSDHEFSPESDLEKDQESEPLRRARTAQKAQSDVEEAEDEYACQKCGKADHPEWILLCDSCDKGWHCSCLRPALMLIPEGDWFCPPCQHNLLVTKLQETLKTFDQLTKRHENEMLRKKRLAFVGISLDNVLHKGEAQRLPKGSKASSQESDNESTSSSSASSSETSSSEESEPVYQLRERRCASTYKFNEYDDMINAAIQDEVEAVQGAGNQGRGKDIATIVNAEKEEAQAEALKMTQLEEEREEIERKSEKESDEEYKVENEDMVDEMEEEQNTVAKKLLARKKHRKLNSLDISSEDDPDSDEDFKGSSSDEEEDFDDHITSSDESSFADVKRRGRKGDSRPVRRSTRARMTRAYDEDFINDDSEESDRPKKKKSRSMWGDSDSEDSDNSWRQRKKKTKTMAPSRIRTIPKTKGKKKKKRKRIIESDNQSENDEEDEPKIEEQCEPNLQDVDTTGLNEMLDVNKQENFENSMSENNVEMKDDRLQEATSEIPQIPQIPQTQEIMPIQKIKKDIAPKPKKVPAIRRKIIYGGLPDENKQEEEEILSRRTRGRKINYREEIASDSEEELKKALMMRKAGDSEDEFVVNEADELNDDGDKDSDSGDVYIPKKDALKFKHKSPKAKKPRNSKSPAAKRKSLMDDMPKQRKKPGPKPGSKNKARKKLKDADGDIISSVMDNPIGDIASKIDENLTDNVGLTGTTMSVASSFTGDVPEGALSGLGAGELADLDDEQLEQMMMEDEEYGRRQLELAAIEIAKKKKKEEREAKKLEKARLKALEILAAERQRDANAPEGTDGEVPKKKKRGRRSKAEIIAEQMRRDGAPNLGIGSMAPTIGGLTPDGASNVPHNMNPTLSTVLTPETDRSVEGVHIPLITGPDGQLFNPDGSPMKPKRRGRGKGKKTLAMEAARAAEAAAKAAVDVGLIGMGTDSNPEMKNDIPNVLPTPGSSTSGSAPSTPPASAVPTPCPPSTTPSNTQPVYPSLPPGQQSSVITRMLQSQPVSSSPQSFTAAAAAMGHKYFGGPNTGGQIMGGPRTGYEMQQRARIPSPYRQAGQSTMPPHFAAVRSGTPPMRMRVPGQQMYHTSHHPMDPSPSGGGPIAINNRDRSSPLTPGPAMIPPSAGSPLAKGGPTPPPPPYVRGGPPMARFAESPMGPRHQMPPFTNASPVNHNMQQPSPPPNRPPGNFSPYHPPPPPNYHYGAYPPPPPMSTADDAAAYQGSPYTSEHFSSPADNQPPIQAPPPQGPPPQQPHPGDPGAGNKQYDEEGTGEFGGLVSYFSSQREDDLDS